MRRWFLRSSGRATTAALLATRSRGQSADGGFVERRGHLHALEVEGRDLLPLAVLEDGEIALLEAAHELTGLCVTRHHVGQHQIAVLLEHVAALRRVGYLPARGFPGSWANTVRAPVNNSDSATIPAPIPFAQRS